MFDNCGCCNELKRTKIIDNCVMKMGVPGGVDGKESGYSLKHKGDISRENTSVIRIIYMTLHPLSDCSCRFSPLLK